MDGWEEGGVKAEGREGWLQGASRTWQLLAQVGDDTRKMVVAAGDQPSWPRSQQENSSTNWGSEKTKEKRNREESQTGEEAKQWRSGRDHSYKSQSKETKQYQWFLKQQNQFIGFGDKISYVNRIYLFF